ncbi:hypothetical protein ROZALSC1DRAFT_25484 [Rozella allomycis CSF55]|uniref:SAM domain-containing protein n=1 Tax=Rozella allomycis (strain CSF55) TaxID=988480 RepID=A0A4P9YDI2_ROZAC|nr:hypothetical protein ROZALSC1DRAFT_25484 [Rozella allomycis CSF55]
MSEMSEKKQMIEMSEKNKISDFNLNENKLNQFNLNERKQIVSSQTNQIESNEQKQIDFWMKFFLSAGISNFDSKQYAEEFLKRKFDEKTISTFSRELLKELNIGEGDIQRIKKILPENHPLNVKSMESLDSSFSKTQISPLSSRRSSRLNNQSTTPPLPTAENMINANRKSSYQSSNQQSSNQQSSNINQFQFNSLPSNFKNATFSATNVQNTTNSIPTNVPSSIATNVPLANLPRSSSSQFNLPLNNNSNSFQNIPNQFSSSNIIKPNASQPFNTLNGSTSNPNSIPSTLSSNIPSNMPPTMSTNMPSNIPLNNMPANMSTNNMPILNNSAYFNNNSLQPNINNSFQMNNSMNSSMNSLPMTNANRFNNNAIPLNNNVGFNNIPLNNTQLPNYNSMVNSMPIMNNSSMQINNNPIPNSQSNRNTFNPSINYYNAQGNMQPLQPQIQGIQPFGLRNKSFLI